MMITSGKQEIDIDSIARLAKLTFTEKEKSVLRNDMESMTVFARVLSDFKAETSEKSFSEAVNVFGNDEEKPSFPREELLSGAKTKTQQYITVPRVVE